MLNESDINTCIYDFSNIVFDISFQLQGKTCSLKRTIRPNVKRSPWFNNECKASKIEFYRCKRLFSESPTDVHRHLFLNARKQFCNVKKIAKRNYFDREKRTLSDLNKSNSRKFWKYIRKYNNRCNRKGNDISLDDFINHFRNISNTQHESTFNDDDYSVRDEALHIDSLDCPFSLNEVKETISSLKRFKSSDIDGNVADFFIDSNEFIAPYLVKIFNVIYDKGEYPEAWSKGAIVPIHKKGDYTDPANYRGITLVNVVAKIFSLVLRNRINKFCENENVLNDSQFGFRDKRSTADCIFLLHAIIQKVLLNKCKLYCAFIDYEKAFDTVIHEALWIKLVQSGISCKIIKMIKAIYENVKSCIKNHDNSSNAQFFDISLGLKQGEPLSPLLFILFVNDISSCINFSQLSNDDINLLSMYMLLFADDIALFTTNPDSLQLQLNQVYEYSRKWGLKINVDKTKICIFEKRKSRHNYTWFVDNEPIEIVDSFCYLGIQFFYTGSMVNAVKTLSDQALKAYNNLLSVFSRIKLDIKTKLSLFDSLVVPILLYGSEVWGIYNCKEIDKLHLRFCKIVLGVRPQTSNAAVLGELGRFPLSVICKERALKYWLNIMKYPGSLVHTIFLEQCALLPNNTMSTWSSSVKKQLDSLGYSYLWNSLNLDMNYLPMLKQRLRDQYVQTWNDTIMNQSKLYYYRKFKCEFKYEKYLDIVTNEHQRKELSRFRLCSHLLEIESGRFAGIDRNLRTCKLCSLNVESEYHFLLCCPLYRNLRRKYNVNYSFPCINKFTRLLSSNNNRTIRNIAKFVFYAMHLRNEKLAIIAAS
jgi:hypothetical protein